VAGYPLICERCGQLFDHPLFQVSGAGATINATDETRIGPHPGCGGYGRSVAVVLQTTRAGATAVLSTQLTETEQVEAAALLRRLHGNLTLQELEDIVVTGPAWLRIAAQTIPAAADPEQRRFWLALLISVLALLVSGTGALIAHEDAEQAHQDAVRAHADAEQALRAVTENDEKLIKVVAQALRQRSVIREKKRPLRRDQPDRTQPVERTARNAPCPCGSGRKYKRCHGGAGRSNPDQPPEQGRRPGQRLSP
jgi:hypothetical protein